MSEKSSYLYQKCLDEDGESSHNLVVRISSESIQHFLQTLSTFLWVITLLWLEVSSLAMYFLIFFKCGILGKIFCICYATHMYNDRNAPEYGTRGQGVSFIRNLSWYRHFANYFPVSIVKTVDLPPTKNYLFAVYPHGVISIGAFCNFATTATGFYKLFPGIRSRLCTLNYHFYIPFYRELVLAWGVIPANRESIMHQLNQSNHKTAICNEDGYTSNAVVLVVGGAQEALNARPGNYKIVVKKRKGFVRVALETGASLVPVISFGETEVFDQPLNDPGTRIRKFQNLVKKWTGIAPALFYGRGFMSKSSGFLPYNRPITTVIGAPIDVERNLEPSKDDIDELHNKFMEEIQKLFDDNKNKYLKNWEDVTLVME